jgi:hypothetical protein
MGCDPSVSDDARFDQPNASSRNRKDRTITMAKAHPFSTRNPGVFGLLAMTTARAYFPTTDQTVRPARSARSAYGATSKIAVSALAQRLRHLAAERRAAR